MCTRNLSLLSCIVQIVFLFDAVNFSVAQSRCTKTERTYNTYRELTYDTVQLTRKNWFGRVSQYSSPISYYVTKYRPIDHVVSVCCPGYINHRNGECIPVCRTACPPNGYCSTPNFCKCNLGYLLRDDKCEPDCRDKCMLNEHCSAPNVCECKEGYSRNMDKNECVPVCSLGCPEYEFCTAPNTCDCQPGYRRSQSNQCAPVCSLACSEHEFCSAPNTCDCLPGYQRKDDNQCAPVCSLACSEHEFCTAPNTCVCQSGYQRNESNSTAIEHFNLAGCQPICSEVCPEHSVCSEPNQCECLNGYKMQTQNNENKFCEPQCDRDCSEYARCSAPNVCTCYPGYEMQNTTAEKFHCQPKCSEPCVDGFCFAPETCVCNNGYTMGPENKCLPQCLNDCIHGECVAPYTCACKPGYTFLQDSNNICEPLCEPACINAQCVAPNTCFCEPNYEPSSLEDPTVAHICVHPTTTTELYTTPTDFEESETSSSPTFTEDITQSESTGVFESSTSPDISTTIAEVLVPADSCQAQCKCWRSMNLTDDNCVHLCLDGNDEPCLNMSQCYCIERFPRELLLVCGGRDEQADHYKCKVRLQVTTPSSLDEHFGAQTVQRNQENASQLLVLVGSVIAVAIIVAAVLYASWIRYRKFRKGGTSEENQAIEAYDVMYTNGTD